ncbi:hypothetical protein RJ641_035011 [Dillenia turbinata]|uniref:F-box domain-containing protein n=1 Tax=Dillenia turbinata TaxID=194707 RepID=A0AAN8VS85_9MAGN
MANPVTTTESSSSANKRRKLHRLFLRHQNQHHNHYHNQNQNQSDNANHEPLIPGLPDHIAQLCLSQVQNPTTLFSVCHSWRRLLYSPSFTPFLSLYALLSPQSQSSTCEFFSFDPISSNWLRLPPPPLPHRHLLLHHHPSFLSWNFPIQSVSAAGKLILLAATTPQLLPALPFPLVFDPISLNWSSGPPLSAPRRWCAAGAVSGSVYVASGVGSHYQIDVARSVEKWDLTQIKTQQYWTKLGCLKDGKLCREAVDGVGWRGKLCMVMVKGDATKGGVVYDVERDVWEEMKEGMIGGWRGPVAAMDEQVIYCVDQVKGVVRKYREESDSWEEIVRSVRLKGAEQMAAGGGRLCMVAGGGKEIVVVDVVAVRPRLWVVDLPVGFEAVAVHVLPRMPHPPAITSSSSSALS